MGLAMQSPVLSQVRITGLGPGTQLSLNIDRDKAAALGVDFNEAAALISTAVGSAYLSKFPNLGRMQNIWVQADAPYRMQLKDVLALNARNLQGGMVPLSSFVTAEWKQGPVRWCATTAMSRSVSVAMPRRAIPPAMPWPRWSAWWRSCRRATASSGTACPTRNARPATRPRS